MSEPPPANHPDDLPISATVPASLSPARLSLPRLGVYGLLITGSLLMFFNREVSNLLGLPLLAIQLFSLALLLVGAVLFFGMRQRPNRAASYRSLVTPITPSEPEPEKLHDDASLGKPQ